MHTYNYVPSTVYTINMPPKSKKKTIMLDDLSECSDEDLKGLSEEGRTIVTLLSNKLDKIVSEFTEMISNKDARINKLEGELTEMKQNMGELIERVDHMEARERKDIIVISGDGICALSTEENTAHRACEIIKNKLNYNISIDAITSAHRAGQKLPTQGADNRNIIVKLGRPGAAGDILRASRTIRPPNFYVNESLTPLRSKVLYSLRRIKKQHPETLAACGSHDGKVYAWVKSSNPAARNTKVFLNSEKQLNDFCMRTLDKPLLALLNESTK